MSKFIKYKGERYVRCDENIDKRKVDNYLSTIIEVAGKLRKNIDKLSDERCNQWVVEALRKLDLMS